jgi:hypothetical protein
MAPGGRKYPPIVSSNFTIIEKKNDKSNRYWLQCNHIMQQGNLFIDDMLTCTQEMKLVSILIL